MNDIAAGVDRLVSLLGGWPDHFGDAEKKHGASILQVLRREKTIDEAVFGLVVRYATHRAAYDRLSKQIDEDDQSAEKDSYLSGKEQSRAFHENKLLILERELLATPYARSKNGMSTQTTFLDLLNEPDPSGPDGDDKVTPFKPLRKRKGRA